MNLEKVKALGGGLNYHINPDWDKEVLKLANGKGVVRHGVTIIDYTDMASRLAQQASTLYAINLPCLTEELFKEKNGIINVNMVDEVIRCGMPKSPGRR